MELLPKSPEALNGLRGGVWVGVSASRGGKVALRVYANNEWGDELARWQRLTEVLRRLGAGGFGRLLRANLADLTSSFSPAGLAVSLADPPVLKLYLRPVRQPWEACARLAQRPDFDLPQGFMHTIDECLKRPLADAPERAIVLSIGGSPDGANADLKLDLNPQYLPGDAHPPEAAIESLAAAYGLDLAPYRQTLATLRGAAPDGFTIAHDFLGFGGNGRGLRLNVYLRPVAAHAVSRPAHKREEIAVITFNQIPRINPTFKYEVLGRLAIENRRQYCKRHGYRLISDVPVVHGRPACWAKIPAILEAFETHPWVLWADSDTLVSNPSRPLEEFCDSGCDLIVQSQEHYFRFLGVPVAEALDRMPINTGVFLIRASAWSAEFLRRAYEQTQFVSQSELWNGIGEQEAMIALLHQRPEDRKRIRYVEGLQNHPRFYSPGDLFVHFYGNYAAHRIPLTRCREVLDRWESAIRRGDGELPADLARFHWCSIQNKHADALPVRGDLTHFLYRTQDIAPLAAAEENAALAHTR
jgi:hypothetical protein